MSLTGVFNASCSCQNSTADGHSTPSQHCMSRSAAGDVWYFPANLAHSIVGLEPEGCAFVSGYKSPDFDELKSFSASSWLATLPVDTLAQVRAWCTAVSVNE
jgi:hypothetical protein